MISSENGRLFIYAWCHMCVDALCCLLLYQTHANAWLWIIGYHALAFALQPVFGLMIDRHPAIPAGKISILLILGAYTLQHFPTLAVSFAASVCMQRGRCFVRAAITVTIRPKSRSRSG